MGMFSKTAAEYIGESWDEEEKIHRMKLMQTAHQHGAGLEIHRYDDGERVFVNVDLAIDVVEEILIQGPMPQGTEERQFGEEGPTRPDGGVR